MFDVSTVYELIIISIGLGFIITYFLDPFLDFVRKWSPPYDS